MRHLLLPFLSLVLAIGCNIAPSGDAPQRSASASSPVGALSTRETEGPFQTCLRDLAVNGEEASVRRSVEWKYRLSRDDAHDLVRDAMLQVCLRHATKHYRNVGAVLQTAAERRARSDWRHSLARHVRRCVDRE